MRHDDGEGWLADVRQALNHAAVGHLVEPPQWVRDRARRLFRTPIGGSGLNLSLLVERVRAALLFDSRRTGGAAAGVRSTARSTALLEGALQGPWQLLYRGGDVDVDLLVRPNQDGRTMTLRGQALSFAGDSVGPGVVEALPVNTLRRLHATSQPLPVLRTDVEPTGEFALSNIERGRYDVLLRFGAHEIELSGVEL
jgi:hypothetical protein